MAKPYLSRREFLQTTAGVAGASLAGSSMFLGSNLSAAEAQTSAPGDRVRFGIVGVGMEGSGLLTTAVQLPGVECVAAADLYDGRHELATGIGSRTNRRLLRHRPGWRVAKRLVNQGCAGDTNPERRSSDNDCNRCCE